MFLKDFIFKKYDDFLYTFTLCKRHKKEVVDHLMKAEKSFLGDAISSSDDAFVVFIYCNNVEVWINNYGLLYQATNIC